MFNNYPHLLHFQVEVVSSATLLDLQTIPPPVYFKASLDVATLIQPHIIKHLVKEGTLIALSLGTLIDRDNVIALLPNGMSCVCVKAGSISLYPVPEVFH